MNCGPLLSAVHICVSHMLSIIYSTLYSVITPLPWPEGTELQVAVMEVDDEVVALNSVGGWSGTASRKTQIRK